MDERDSKDGAEILKRLHAVGQVNLSNEGETINDDNPGQNQRRDMNGFGNQEAH